MDTDASNLALHFLDDLEQARSHFTFDAEAHCWSSPLVSRTPVSIEPSFRHFDPRLHYMRGTVPSPFCPQPLSRAWHLFSISSVYETCLRPDAYQDLAARLLASDSRMSIEAIATHKNRSVFFGIPDSHSLHSALTSWKALNPSTTLTQVNHCPLECLLGVQEQRLFLLDVYAPAPYYHCLCMGTGLPDLITDFFLASSALAPDELSLLQILIQPVSNQWSSNIACLTRNEQPKSCPAQLKSLALPLYAVSIRFASHNQTVLRNLISLLGSLSWAGKKLLFRTEHDLLKVLSINQVGQMLHGRYAHSTGMLLNSEELAHVIHLPVLHDGKPPVAIDNFSMFPIPESLSKGSLLLGKEGTRPIHLPPHGNSNIFVIGTSRYGKSSFINNFALSLVKQGQAVALFDPHGDTVDELMHHIPKEHHSRTIYFNPAEQRAIPRYNPFAEHDADPGRAASYLVSAFEALFESSWGQRVSHLLAKGIASLFCLQENLSALPILFSHSEAGNRLRHKLVSGLANKELLRFWRTEFPSHRPESFLPILNKISSLLMDKRFHHFFSQKQTSFSASDIAAHNRVLLASLPVGILGSEVTSLFGSILISQFQLSAMSQASLPKHRRRPLWLVIDEWHRFPAYKTFANTLNEAQKYRLNIMLANQVCSQIPSSLLDTLLSLPNILLFNCNFKDAGKLCQMFSGKVTPNQLSNLPPGEVYARIGGHPVHFITPTPLGNANPVNSHQLKKLSFDRYYTNLDSVERPVQQIQRQYDLI